MGLLAAAAPSLAEYFAYGEEMKLFFFLSSSYEMRVSSRAQQINVIEKFAAVVVPQSISGTRRINYKHPLTGFRASDFFSAVLYFSFHGFFFCGFKRKVR